MVDKAAVEVVVGAVEEPELGRSLAQLGMIRSLDINRKGRVEVQVAVPVPGYALARLIGEEIEGAVAAVDGVTSVDVSFIDMDDEDRRQMMGDLRPERGMTFARAGSPTRVVTISSGKGGVGKSSVTANLAVALAQQGHSVGVIDADVWGFSIPKMLGVTRPPSVIDETIIAPQAHGVKVISMDYFVRPDQAVIWRGPMLHKALEQFLSDVFWDDPDFLLIDMPPGTGDVAISVSQFVPRAQVVVVTTPQPTAQRVAKRAALMAEKVNQEVMGVVENMSWFTGDDGTRYALFGEGGGATLAEELGVPLLARIPFLSAMRAGADEGHPLTSVAPESEAALAFDELARGVVATRPRVRTHPELVIK
jgi:ATP-binding protein involved in chromosome partitioning